ncbi:MAG: cytochrome c biogenesis protein CcsA, partial [Burkholderiales bacterium]
AIESRFVPMLGVRRALAALGIATLMLVALFPGETHLHPTSPWAPLHWLLGLVSYALFAAAVLHAAMLSRSERAMRSRHAMPAGNGLPAGAPAAPAPMQSGLPLLKLEALTFRFVLAGFIVLSAAIVLGLVYSSGWRWDHKTVFSLLGWAVFAALLAGRRAFGWRGRRATRWVYVGAVLLLLAYAGSRFVFEVLLHRNPG